MKKTKKTLLLIGFIVCSSLLSACGGLHSSNKIYAKNLITGKSLTIPIDVYNYADTGNFSNFTTHLSFSELQKELESADAVNTAINIYHTLSTGYMKLETTNGNFFMSNTILQITEITTTRFLQMSVEQKNLGNTFTYHFICSKNFQILTTLQMLLRLRGKCIIKNFMILMILRNTTVTRKYMI